MIQPKRVKNASDGEPARDGGGRPYHRVRADHPRPGHPGKPRPEQTTPGSGGYHKATRSDTDPGSSRKESNKY